MGDRYKCNEPISGILSLNSVQSLSVILSELYVADNLIVSW
jgi:hypothetical protein